MANKVEKDLLLRVAPEKVWQFLTEPACLARWFHPANRVLDSTGPYHFTKTLAETEAYCWGEVLEVLPLERLVYTFTHPWLKEHPTRVEWSLQSHPEGTLLRLRHDGFEGGPVAAIEAFTDHDKGWDEHLELLAAALQ